MQNGRCVFLWFYNFIFFIFLCHFIRIWHWSLKMPSDCDFLALLLCRHREGVPRDVPLHEEGYFGLCDGGGVGGSGAVGESDKTGVFRIPLLVCGGGGIFESGFLVVGR